MPVIKVSHLNKKFSNAYAVEDLSFSVNEADIYGFLGQNGAGKSTTIRMLLTLIEPTSGDIELFGMNLRTKRKEILKQIGAVIERPDMYKYLSGYENLALFAKMSGMRIVRKQLMEHLEMVGLAQRAGSKIRTYSQGMKQRLGIAHLSRHLKKTVVVSSHLLNEIEQIASSMLIIDKGKKIVEGSVDELFDPAKTIVEIEVSDGKAAAEKIRQSNWGGYLQEVRANTLLLQLHKNQVPVLNKDLINMHIDVMSLRPGNSLEKYFLSLTGSNQHVAAFTN